MAGPRIYKDVALRIAGDAADFTEVDVRRRLQQIRVRIERDVRLSGKREGSQDHDEYNLQKAFHDGLLIFHPRLT
jgi:hypothetical protein